MIGADGVLIDDVRQPALVLGHEQREQLGEQRQVDPRVRQHVRVRDELPDERPERRLDQHGVVGRRNLVQACAEFGRHTFPVLQRHLPITISQITSPLSISHLSRDLLKVKNINLLNLINSSMKILTKILKF